MRQASANADGYGVSEPVREEERFYAVGDSGGSVCGFFNKFSPTPTPNQALSNLFLL